MEFHDFLTAANEQLHANSFLFVKDTNQNRIDGLFTRIENPVCYVVYLHAKDDSPAALRNFYSYSQFMAKNKADLYCTHVIGLEIVIDDESAAQQATQGLHTPAQDEISQDEILQDESLHYVKWNFSPNSGTLTAGKDQPTKLLGIEKLLMAAAKGDTAIQPPKPRLSTTKPVGTIGIFIICAVLMVLRYLPMGNDLISMFAVSRNSVLDGEVYRLLTSMFLHSDIGHLASNGIYLFYFGTRTEQLLGTKKFLVLYLISGLCGGLCSIAFHNVFAIGASGAIYGLLGAMLLFTKKYGQAYTHMNYSTMLLLAISAIGIGFLMPNVDNFAHIGGFIGGVVLFFIFLRSIEKE